VRTLVNTAVAVAAGLGIVIGVTHRIYQPPAAPPAPATLSVAPRSVTPLPPKAVPATAAAPQPPPSPEPPPSQAPPTTPLEDLVSRVMPAVITVQTPTARGSGFFVSADTVLTNVHVVGTDATVIIRRPTGETTTARVATLAPAFDIAVLKLADPAPNQPIIPLGATASIRVGEDVVAIGTPLGFLQNTVSRGIVSGLREVDGATLVQTDAAINPGNSGGPLLDRNGFAIGIIKSGYRGSDGLSFAVAIDHARAVLSGTLAPPPGGATSPSPYQALAPAVASPDEQRRTERLQHFEQAVAALARRADALDAQWRSFVTSCYQGSIAGAYDRPWFALWNDGAMQGAVAPGCTPYFSTLEQAAHDIHDAVAASDEAARQADIYPGTRREILRKYRLDYPGW
jgi:S1-C subfamily serine protease